MQVKGSVELFCTVCINVYICNVCIFIQNVFWWWMFHRKCQRQCAFVQHSQPLQQQTRLIHRLRLDSVDIFIVTYIIILFMLQMIL